MCVHSFRTPDDCLHQLHCGFVVCRVFGTQNHQRQLRNIPLRHCYGEKELSFNQPSGIRRILSKNLLGPFSNAVVDWLGLYAARLATKT